MAKPRCLLCFEYILTFSILLQQQFNHREKQEHIFLFQIFMDLHSPTFILLNENGSSKFIPCKADLGIQYLQFTLIHT
jgi:hypothetical protein